MLADLTIARPFLQLTHPIPRHTAFHCWPMAGV